MQHLMEHHILQSQPWRARIVEDPADHDHVVRRVEMSQPRTRPNMTPAQFRTRHHAAEMAGIQILENANQIVRDSGRTLVRFPAARLPGQVDSAAAYPGD